MTINEYRVVFSLLQGVSFIFLSSTLIFLGTILPYGLLISGGIFFGSPFLWLLIVLELVNGPFIITAVAVLAPYFLVGVLVGYLRPFSPDQTIQRKLRIIILRFLTTVAVMWPIGISLGLWAMAHDS